MGVVSSSPLPLALALSPHSQVRAPAFNYDVYAAVEAVPVLARGVRGDLVKAAATFTGEEAFRSISAAVGDMRDHAALVPTVSVLLGDVRVRETGWEGETAPLRDALCACLPLATPLDSRSYTADARACRRALCWSPSLAAAIDAVACFPPEVTYGGFLWRLEGVSHALRVIEYRGVGSLFARHRDGYFFQGDERRTFFSALLYLDDVPAEAGGATQFFAEGAAPDAPPITTIQPLAGRLVWFPHALPHAGAPLLTADAVKTLVRADVVYRRELAIPSHSS